MRLCKTCGCNIPDGYAFCTSCGASADGAIDPAGVSGGPGGGYNGGPGGGYNGGPGGGYNGGPGGGYNGGPGGGYGLRATQNMPMLSEGEILVKSYNCARLVRPSCEGYISVTNRRVIFHADSDSSHISEEVYMDSISGLSCLTGRNVKLGLMLLGILLAIVGLVLLVEGNASPIVGLVALLLGALFIFLSIKSTYHLSIYSSKANESPITVGEGAKSLLGNGAVLSLQCSPTSETYTMINELGALILDLQSMGDHAIEKWQSKGARR